MHLPADNNKESNPAISVIVPVYNVREYLSDCLDSLISQTFNDIEIICVDDGSTDGCSELLDEYREKDSRVSVLHLGENRGLVYARKKGVQQAHGDYIMFCDSDDRYAPDACRRVYEEMQLDSVDILQFGTEVVWCGDYSDSEKKALEDFLKPCNEIISGDLCVACFKEKRWNHNLWNKAYSAEMCKKAYSDACEERIVVAEDLYAFFLISFYASTYRGIRDKLYVYYYGRGVTGGTHLNIAQFKNHVTSLNIIKALFDFAESNDLGSGHVDMIRTIADREMDDIMYKWYVQLSIADSKKGYSLLVEKLGASEAVSELAKRYWWDGPRLLDRLVDRERCIEAGRPVKCLGVYYHRMHNGGVERVLSKLLPMWKLMGYRIILFTDEKATDDDYPIPDGITRIVLPDYIEHQGARYKERAVCWEAMIRQYDVDTIVYNAAFNENLLWDTLLIKGLACNLVVEVHSIFCGLMRYNPVFSSSLSRIYRMVDRIVVLSHVDACFWKNYAPAYYIPNPIDDVPEDEISSCASKNIVWVGRLAEDKKPYRILEAMEIVLEKVPDATLTIVGAGETPDWIEGMRRYVHKHHMEHAVELRGFESEVGRFYQAASILTMTSPSEGFPMVLAEGMVHGLPVVMYELPYLELVRGNEGVISVPQGDVSAMADALICLLNDDDKRKSMGKAARRKIDEFLKFDIKAAWEEVFASFTNPPTYQPDKDAEMMLDLLFENVLLGIDRIQGGTGTGMVSTRNPGIANRLIVKTLNAVLKIHDNRNIASLRDTIYNFGIKAALRSICDR